MRFGSLVGLGLEEHEIRVSVKRGIVGWVALHGHPVRLEDAYADPRSTPLWTPSSDTAHTRWLALPNPDKSDDIIGVLELLNKTEGSFSDFDQEFLSGLWTMLRWHWTTHSCTASCLQNSAWRAT